MKILHIVNYDLDRPNGIKTVLEDIIPVQKKFLKKVDIYNIKHEANIKNSIEQYDLIIFHGVYEKRYLNFYKKLKKVPYIIVPHCSLTKESLKRSKIKKYIFNFLAQNFYKNAEAIGFLNFEEKENSIKVNKKFVILPNGINLPKKVNNIEKSLKENLNIIYLSRIDIYHKGLDLLIEAVKIIKNQLLKKKIIINIYGNAFFKKNLDYLITEIEKNELQKILKYHGRVDGEEKEIALQANNLFILTSRFEGFPMSVLEALSYGKPCILTEGTNMKEMIEQYRSGWVCKTEVYDISQLILKAIQEFKLNENKYINNALKNAEDYEWNKVIKLHIEEYRKIIKAKNEV